MNVSIKIPKELEAPKIKGSQQLSQPTNLRDEGEHYAAQVTTDMTCRCPHLDAYFPKYLDSGSLGIFQEGRSQQRNAKRPKRLTISDLHLSSILPPKSPSNPPQSQRPYAFGNEERKTDIIMSGGGGSFTPLYPGTFVDHVMKERAFEMHLCKEIPDETATNLSSGSGKPDEIIKGEDLGSISSSKNNNGEMKEPKKNILPGDKNEVPMSPVLSRNKTKKHGGQALNAEEWHIMQKQRDADIEAANSRVEIWMATIRQNRLAHWKQGAHSPTDSSRPNCKQCSKKAKSGRVLPSGDALMQCLDCSLILCGSDCLTQDNGGRRHMQQHFLLSNHNFAITCGEKGEIFCMKCGDFVYCDIFNTEKERVEIESKLPWFGWSRYRRLGRGFCFGEEDDDFYLIPNAIGNEISKLDLEESSRASSSLSKSVSRSIVWKGLQATYPIEVSDEMIAAAQRTLHRLRIFHGDLSPSTYLAWDKSTCEFAIRQRERGQAPWSITAPVGIYNAGNICYISSVIQCIFNLRPIQRFFLRDVKHDFEACKMLRSAAAHRKHASELCLACEIDKLMLNYYGNTVGLDVCTIIGGSRGLSGPKSPLLSYSTTDSSKKNQLESDSDEPTVPVLKKGMPMVVSDFLATAWQLKDMATLAGNDQHDSHEFMQVFLDIIDKDCERFQRIISSATELSARSGKIRVPGLRPAPKIPGSMTSFFSGNLRSVLMCDTCGFKRKHMEPFINVSLSLPLNKGATSSARKYNERRENISSRRRAQKIDVRTCINHFSDPEPLADEVYCDWCKAKTKTQKQHTFAKLPTILCLHLKRFDAVTNKKIDEPVSFPSVLDMGPYLPHWREVEQTDVMLRGSERKIVEENASSPSILYDLCSTINHSGTLFQGHYISNVKVDNNWYSCSDSEIHRYSEEHAEREVLGNGEAYMLFYMRRSQ